MTTHAERLHAPRTTAVPVTVAAPVAVPAPVADPAIVGLPTFIVGAMALALTLTGYVPETLAGAALPLIIMAAGIGHLLACGWAMRLGQSAVAGIYAVFAGFWLSYSFLVLGLTHKWLGMTSLADVKDTKSLFLISWLVVIGALILGTLALPWTYTLLFSLVELSLALSLSATLSASNALTLTHLAGWAVFGFTAVGVYLFVSACRQATGVRAFPAGRPVWKA